MQSVCAIFAEKFKRNHPELSLDEAMVVGFFAKPSGRMQKPPIGDTEPVPEGYFDSTTELDFIDNPNRTHEYCRKLVEKGLLETCPSQPRMVKLNDNILSECNHVFDKL